MNTAKHTPGPWGIRDEWHGDGKEVYPSSVKFEIGEPSELCVVTGLYDQCEANSRLIAAAPDLLEALQNWLGTPDDPKAGWHGSGGTQELFACEYCNAKHGDCTQVPHAPTCPITQARAAIAKATGGAS
jgi:hypothetical protein